MKIRFAFAVTLALLAVAVQASAQSEKDWRINLGANYSMPVGTTADKVDPAFGFVGGFIYKPASWPVGIQAELGYQDFKAPSWTVPTGTPGEFAKLDGHAEVWSLTLNGIWEAKTSGDVGFYVTGGVGAYKRNVAITTFAGYDYIYWCDPWWGYCWAEPVPVDQVLASDSLTKVGFNLGIGTTFRVGYSTQLYLESRFHWVDTPKATEFFPIVFGVRF